MNPKAANIAIELVLIGMCALSWEVQALPNATETPTLIPAPTDTRTPTTTPTPTLTITPNPNPQIYRVAWDATGTADGSTWETAFRTITDAMEVATGGDSVWVQAGTYIETVTMTEGVGLYGGFAGNEMIENWQIRDSRKNKTVIGSNGTGKGNDTARLLGANHSLVESVEISYGKPGVSCRGITMELRNCVVRLNTVGVSCTFGGSIRIKSCLITLNFQDGIRLTFGSSLQLTNSLVVSNSMGYGLRIFDGTAKLTNCTFSGNSHYPNGLPGGPELGDTEFGGFGGTVKVEVYNSIVRYPGGGGQFYHCLVKSREGNGNFDADPGFEQEHSYRFLPNSPCIDAGTDVSVYLDYEDNPRPVDIPGVGREGPGAFDIGAYEYPLGGYPTPTITLTRTPRPTGTPTTTPTRTATETRTPRPTNTMNPKTDIDQDGRVDQMDIFIFIQNWQKGAGN
jgi:hypothetical protein